MIVAMCGLDCEVCPAAVAHRTGDQALRERTAVEWSKQFGAALTAQDIDCVGCLTLDGPHIGHCAECEIRLCGLERHVAHCGECADYPCERLSKFLVMVPPAKTNLEQLRAAREPRPATVRKSKTKPAKAKPRQAARPRKAPARKARRK